MPLFNWSGKSTCGDTPPSSCEPLPSIKQGKAIVVTDPTSACISELNGDEFPALMVATNENDAKLKSGSSAQPIVLTRVQQSQATRIPTLFYRNEAGQLTVWKPPVTCDGKKLVVQNGEFVLTDDVSPNSFNTDCVGSYAGVEYIVGATMFTDCAGIQRVKLVLFPKSELP